MDAYGSYHYLEVAVIRPVEEPVAIIIVYPKERAVEPWPVKTGVPTANIAVRPPVVRIEVVPYNERRSPVKLVGGKVPLLGCWRIDPYIVWVMPSFLRTIVFTCAVIVITVPAVKT